jgi:carboxypeptidase C (cathepsin A)
MTARLLAALALVLSGCGGGGGGSDAPPPPPATPSYTDPQVYSSAAGASLSSPNEITAVTRHQLALNGQTLGYTATVGHLTARELGTGAPRASFFYVAYTLDGTAPATRPVTFFYNGGPGSASVWLHIGSFGPRRLATGVPATNLPTPFALVPNDESLLDVSDMVFVDAVGSGYSQAIAPNANRTFWGVDDDAAVFRDFVMSYTMVNNRASSPKFLFGESYGGPRAAVMADLLEAAGVRLHGVVLQSPAMNYNSNCGTGTPTSSCAGYLPSYGASGAWYGRSNPSPPQDQLGGLMVAGRALATQTYQPAVATWLASGALPAEPVIDALRDFSGLDASRWQARFNVGPDYYRQFLVAGSMLGRYDSRISSDTVTNPATDPSSNLIGQSFYFRITEYLGSTLGYTTPSTYTLLGNAIQTWRFAHDGNALPDTIPDLAAALAQNPRLKVLAVNGYHDLATPFFTTEQDLARLGSGNVQVRNYPGGHMTYLDDTSRAQMRADLAAWYGSALAN